MAGVIFKVVPFPAVEPPHETVYHCQVAPVPNEPPTMVKVIAVPGHTVREGVPETDEAAEDKLFTVIVSLTQEVVLQLPTPITQ